MRSNFKSDKPTPPDARETAISILSWLAQEPDMLARFLALSGMAPAEMRDAVNDTGFLAGLLDFVMGHEPSLLAFCAASQTAPETVAAAWQRLSGPGLSSGDH